MGLPALSSPPEARAASVAFLGDWLCGWGASPYGVEALWAWVSEDRPGALAFPGGGGEERQVQCPSRQANEFPFSFPSSEDRRPRGPTHR